MRAARRLPPVSIAAGLPARGILPASHPEGRVGSMAAGPAEEWPPESAASEGFRRESSSSAPEVEEESFLGRSASTEGGGGGGDDEEEETPLPGSSTLDGEGPPSEATWLPSSEGETSGSGAPPGEESSRPSSSGAGGPSSSSPQPPTSPMSWKRRQEDGLRAGDEEAAASGRATSEEPATESEASASAAETSSGLPGKAPAKKGPLSYTVRPVVPAEKAELVSVAKAMHREHFGRNVKALFHLEKEAALRSLETGLYIGWRCPEYLWDCFRVGDESKCFCGHRLKVHQVCVERQATVPCTQVKCKCQGFTFIPSHPEEVGEFWLRRRTGFDPAAWRARCRCKHTHEEHTPAGARPCCARGCSCTGFTSNFLCAACDRRWEEHQTFFESEETRRKGGRPYGEAYLPFAEMPELRNAVLTGRLQDNSAFQALQGSFPQALPAPSGSRALPLPPSGPRRLAEKDDKKA